MNRKQRAAHARVWPFLLVLGLVLGAAALNAKSRVERALTEASASTSTRD